MNFEALVDEAAALLARRGRLTYGALRRQFELDEAMLQDLRDELIHGRRIAVDEGGTVLVHRLPDGEAADTEPAFLHTQPPPLPVPGRIVEAPRPAERRQLTVMFCDLVGSTALSGRLDPEEYRDILAAYHVTCGEVIMRFGGSVTQHLGDGVLAYFGYPTASEHDARRALKAALAIPPALAAVAAQLPALRGAGLHARIGIHTGLVVVGDTGNERLAMGETPNVAARLQGMAAPDGVLVSAATKRLVEGNFELLGLGVQALKGIAEPVEVFKVLRELDIEDAIDSLQVSEGKMGIVGRDAEMRLLLARWRQAAALQGGEGQVVMVSGDPGIGKSRLVRAIENQVGHDGGQVLTLRCSPYHQNSALYPVVRRLRRDIGLYPRQAAAEARELLASWLRLNGFDEAEALPLFASLLGVAPAEGAAPAPLSAGGKRQVQSLLAEWLLHRAGEQALLVVWEDLHWADPSTLDVIALLLDAAAGARLLVLLTFRPEFAPPWKHAANRAQLVLNRFIAADVEALVLRLTGGKRFPSEVMRLIVLQTDGVPLYVEEVTKLLLESGQLVELVDGYELRGPLSGISIPITLRDSLMARLDRQSPGREVAQLGATVGREFSQQLIEMLWSPAPGLLEEGLNQLVEAELLFRRQIGRQSTYVFKHALVQEVAYESLLKRTREEYHARIVEVLEGRFPELARSQPEVLAHHYTGAGLIGRAVPAWRAAAERAIETSAHAEAIAHVNKAIELQAQLPDSAERRRDEIALHIRLGVSLAALRGYANAAVERAYARARELAYKAELPDLMLPAVYGLWRFHLMRAEYAKARNLGQELLDQATRYRNDEFITMGHRAMASTCFYTGELSQAHAYSSRVLELQMETMQRVQALRYDVVDAWVTASSYRAWAEWLLGREEAALRDSGEAVQAARRLKHPFSHALALSFACWMHQFRGDLEQLRQCAQEALLISQEHGFEFWIGWNEALLGWAASIEGNPRQGAEQIAGGIRRWMATGSRLGRSYLLALQAQALLRARLVDEAGAVLDEALHCVALTQERFWEAELYRLRANWLAASGRSEAEVESCREQALEVAQSQGAVALVRRCEMSAGRGSA